MTNTPFGPFYSPPLQAAIDHADRFAEILATRLERQATPALKAWLLGRTSEVACFVAHVVREWDSRGLDDRAATKAIDDYVAGLHLALARMGVARLRCCTGDEEITSVPVAVTDEIRAVSAEAPAQGTAGDAAANDPDADVAATVEIDPAELLAGLDMANARTWE